MRKTQQHKSIEIRLSLAKKRRHFCPRLFFEFSEWLLKFCAPRGRSLSKKEKSGGEKEETLKRGKIKKEASRRGDRKKGTLRINVSDDLHVLKAIHDLAALRQLLLRIALMDGEGRSEIPPRCIIEAVLRFLQGLRDSIAMQHALWVLAFALAVLQRSLQN